MHIKNFLIEYVTHHVQQHIRWRRQSEVGPLSIFKVGENTDCVKEINHRVALKITRENLLVSPKGQKETSSKGPRDVSDFENRLDVMNKGLNVYKYHFWSFTTIGPSVKHLMNNSVTKKGENQRRKFSIYRKLVKHLVVIIR